MRESQAEIQAIEAQLRSIRANPGPPSRTPPTVAASSVASSKELSTPASSSNHTGPDWAQNRAQTRHSSSRQSGPYGSSSSQALRPAAPSQNFQKQPPQTIRQPDSNGSSGPREELHRSTPQIQHLQLAATVERLQQRTALHVQQYRQLQAQAFQSPDQILDRSLQILEAHVQHINQLSAAQEAAILELKSIAESVEQDWKAFERLHGDYDENDLPICEYLSATVPSIERDPDGVYVISSRSIDLFKAEREANHTAQSLRHWGNRNQVTQAGSTSTWRWWRKLLGSNPDRQTSPSPQTQPAQEPHSPQPTRPAASPAIGSVTRPAVRRRSPRRVSQVKWRESVALFLGAMIVRFGLDLMLTTFPVLWTPAIALLVTPAAIAVYRTSHTPHAGFVWSCRLLVIMIGLLVGGRLL